MRETIYSGRWSQAPLASILFAGSMVMRCGKVEGKIMQVWMKLDILPSVYVYLGEADVAKSRPKGCFSFLEPHAHYWQN
jgi:hypothetical protein